jgi:hypothetical protein
LKRLDLSAGAGQTQAGGSCSKSYEVNMFTPGCQSVSSTGTAFTGVNANKTSHSFHNGSHL